MTEHYSAKSGRSGHMVRHVGGRAASVLWTDDQLEILLLHWREMTDVDMAVLLSQHGPERTVSSVIDKRHALKLARPRGYDRAAKAASGRATAAGMQGWPVIHRDSERVGLVRMFDELRAERERLSGRGVAA